MEAFPPGGEAVLVVVFDGVALDNAHLGSRSGLGAVAGSDAHLVRTHRRLILGEILIGIIPTRGQQTCSACKKKDLIQRRTPGLK